MNVMRGRNSEMDKGYELIDCGGSQRLERFGAVTVCRSCAGAAWEKAVPECVWQQARIIYSGESGKQGEWRGEDALPADWQVEFDDIVFSLLPGALGQIGVFPEQLKHWRWIRSVLSEAGRPLNVVNLFAFTGGSTLAAASVPGVSVTHLDASKASVKRAQENAKLSRLDNRPVRWIVDDATTFISREVKRGNRYDAIILDPPAFGRGGNGKTWKLSHDLPKMLSCLPRILSDKPLFVLLTCHDPEWPVERLRRLLSGCGLPGGEISTGDSSIPSNGDGHALPCGVFVRWKSI